MDERLVEFAALLRQNGLRVSSAELADAARALVLCGFDDRETVRAALRATLLKRGADAPVFEQLFELYFFGLRRILGDLEASLLSQIEAEGLLEGDELEMILYTLRKEASRLSPLARALLEGDAMTLARLFRGAALALDFGQLASSLQTGFYARRLFSAAGGLEARRELDELSQTLAGLGAQARAVELVGGKLSERLRGVEGALRRYVEEERRARTVREGTDEGGLAERPLARLSQEELEKTSLAVRRLAEKLKSRLSRRARERHRGALHVRRTLRRNLGLGGFPARLAFRKRRPERPDVVILCDVSDSVRNVSRMMLLFVHTLQSLYARVRSFAFVSDIGEVTQHFKDVDAARAVDVALTGSAVSLHANSNYGRALSLFVKDHLGAVSGKTTVLVIGDGRNNHHPAHVWALEELRRKAKRVVWITPEEERSWDLGDSELRLYSRAVDRVLVVRTLTELERAADEIVAV